MRKKIKAILAVTLAVCMTLSGTVMAFAEGEDSGSAGGEGRHVESITINSETGSFESDPPDSVDVQNITSESCDVHTLADPDTGYSEQFVIDESTRVTIDGNNASQSSSRTDTDSITWYTYNVNSDDSSESDDDSNNDDSNNDDSSDCSKDKETSDDSKDKDSSGDSDSGESQFTLWSPATVSTAGVTVGNVTTATLDPASSNYSSNFVSLIAETPQGGTLDLKITSSAFIYKCYSESEPLWHKTLT